jgi:stage III sporulation protein AG
VINLGNYLETLKNITKDKSKEKLIYILILCVVLFIAISYIFNDNKKTEVSLNENSANSNNTSIQSNINTSKDVMEEKLAKILSEISGINDVSVMITYSSDGKINPVYNTKEEDKEGKKTVDSSVVYNEEDSSKKVVIESTETPKVEGVIVVATGASNVEIRSKIAQAVSAVTNVAIYKIQVFEKKG